MFLSRLFVNITDADIYIVLNITEFLVQMSLLPMQRLCSGV